MADVAVDRGYILRLIALGRVIDVPFVVQIRLVVNLPMPYVIFVAVHHFGQPGTIGRTVCVAAEVIGRRRFVDNDDDADIVTLRRVDLPRRRRRSVKPSYTSRCVPN